MKKLPEGPSPQQAQHDRVIGSIMTLGNMLKTRIRLRDAWSKQDNKRWSPIEASAAEHLNRCEIEALETAIDLLEASLSVPRLTLDAMNTLTRKNVDG